MPEKPVLIAGPTASGKSALALRIAAEQGGVIVNADASQGYDCWRVLTARPAPDEERQTPHALYGHLNAKVRYSAGHWLRDVMPYLAGEARPIIVGGTGLYFTALTRGLADIPPTPAEIRAKGDRLERAEMLAALDARTRDRIDNANRARVQRAWEVQMATGRGLAAWQDETGAPALPLSAAQAIVFDVDKEVLNARIEKRFDLMLAAGALEEARRVLPDYDPTLPAHRAIGAPELIAHLKGQISLEAAREAAITATRQYAKRQRTWFRSKMRHWSAYMP
ncbi:tRNA delta(2)-isopentenylpyrophosphate transferase [Roseobacter denitrificans OCh 114]|uniref:tRNA dimethylallyltransferase n=1 Tax=Roseobacter denitrificans (strain ATCC 33942 / OCh 114) TaxID=375451 RepID=MIAA_ROSDO|nr:RecName: Full=tRNA dimethylallyltransferase; AltName: Full=Dimethylallyl diphosphate:tRNA dimethylallyltransferase; Short=DMAPP:tRNA dimethylallyltransferase; Short=DMATase; AltName: Full=Isopentenyl-diphosphate:tRNA isopentenyltransferase; Short=IPP transferase; Short=IPPT; Short=IPTase [Roseobacter denitrificans OCh 114]ABG32136.1 tRNA delta(2)-isopentenylpyrophosphate transferase [Roseobacter denitrificans OCh 114]